MTRNKRGSNQQNPRPSEQISNDQNFTQVVKTLFCKGLPYIPRVHLSEGSLVRSPLRWLCSEEPVVRRSFIPMFIWSEGCYIPRSPYSERPSTIWILCYEDFLFRSSTSLTGSMFRRFHIPKSPSTIRVLYYQVEGRSWIYVQHVNLRAARRFTCCP